MLRRDLRFLAYDYDSSRLADCETTERNVNRLNILAKMKTTFQNQIHNSVKLMIMVCIGSLLFLPSCRRRVASLDPGIDRNAARSVSDALADDLISDRRDSLRRKLETSFRESVSEQELDSMLSGIVKTYGKPSELEFKRDELGLRTYANAAPKSMRKFWYAAKTTKYDKGYCFLVVEVVPDDDGLGVSSFSIVSFSQGVPDSLR